MEALPNCLSQLKKLRYLDLSECYSLSEIPSEILAMPNLMIKFGNVVTPAAEVALLRLPKWKKKPTMFSVLSPSPHVPPQMEGMGAWCSLTQRDTLELP